MSAGQSADRIAAELGVSVATAKRRMREIKGVVTETTGGLRHERRAAPVPRAERPSRPAPKAERELAPPVDGDETVIEIPEGSSVEQIDRWLKVAEQEAEAASGDPDPDNHIKWVRLAASLLEARRKAAPIVKADPNDRPDTVAAAARVRARWHALADKLVFVANSPLATTIARLKR